MQKPPASFDTVCAYPGERATTLNFIHIHHGMLVTVCAVSGNSFRGTNYQKLTISQAIQFLNIKVHPTNKLLLIYMDTKNALINTKI